MEYTTEFLTAMGYDEDDAEILAFEHEGEDLDWVNEEDF